jgi:hypothetical protein
MKRRVDVIDAKRGAYACRLEDSTLTAVPAVVASHPLACFRDIIIGGNASGRCHVWTPSIDA